MKSGWGREVELPWAEVGYHNLHQEDCVHHFQRRLWQLTYKNLLKYLLLVLRLKYCLFGTRTHDFFSGTYI